MSEPLKPCRVDEVSGWCKEHDSKGRLQEILYCDKGPDPYPRAASARLALLERVAKAAIFQVDALMADPPPDNSFFQAATQRLMDEVAALKALDAGEDAQTVLRP